jgi:hypothetical protein
MFIIRHGYLLLRGITINIITFESATYTLPFEKLTSTSKADKGGTYFFN